MSTVGQGHEGQKRPVIVDGRISSIFDAKPALYLWSPEGISFRSAG